MLENVLFIRAHCLTGLRLAKTFLHLCPCMFVRLRHCAHVFAGGLHIFLIVLNCVSVWCVFVVTHVWAELFVFTHTSSVTPHLPLVSFSAVCTLFPLMDFKQWIYCYCGRAHLLPIHSPTIHEDEGASSHVQHGKCPWPCRDLVLCTFLFHCHLCGRQGVASDTDLRTV